MNADSLIVFIVVLIAVLYLANFIIKKKGCGCGKEAEGPSSCCGTQSSSDHECCGQHNGDASSGCGCDNK